MIAADDSVTTSEFERQTGWTLKSEGACRGDVCVPLPADAVVDGRVHLPSIAERMRMPIVRDEAHGLVALGPAVVSGRVLETAVAPDLALPTIDGEPFQLASLRGTKVLLLAWAPY